MDLMIELIIGEGYDVRIGWYPDSRKFAARAVSGTENLWKDGWGETAGEAVAELFWSINRAQALGYEPTLGPLRRLADTSGGSREVIQNEVANPCQQCPAPKTIKWTELTTTFSRSGRWTLLCNYGTPVPHDPFLTSTPKSSTITQPPAREPEGDSP